MSDQAHDDLGALRAADPARRIAQRGALDSRAQADLAAFLADGDELAARRRLRVSRRWVAPGAAAAAVAVLLTGTFGASQIAAQHEGGGSGWSLFGAPAGPATSSGEDTEAASQARMQAVLDRYRAARAKATPPYLLGTFLDPVRVEEKPTTPRELQDAALDRRFGHVDASLLGGSRWNAYVDAEAAGAFSLVNPGCFQFPSVPATVGPTPTIAPLVPSSPPAPTTMQVSTTTGRVDVPALQFTLGDGSVTVTIPDVPPEAIVSLPCQDATTPPLHMWGPYVPSATTLTLHVTEDELATHGEYAVDVREEDDAVVLSVRVLKRSEPTSPAPTTGFARQTRDVELPQVQLRAPLGGRPILDGATGTWLDREDARAAGG